jgi:hypothetical protein
MNLTTHLIEAKNMQLYAYSLPAREDRLYFVVKAASVGAPDKKDLGGDYYTPETDWGDRYVKSVNVFIDHLHNDETNPYIMPERQLIGAAHLLEKDAAFTAWLQEMGLSESEALHRWYLVELDKANQYTLYLQRLANEKKLGLSTQAYFNSVKRQEDGRLDSWYINEITFTVSPMDATTVGHVYQIAKSLGIEFQKKGHLMADEQNVEVAVAAEVTTVVPPSLEAEITEILAAPPEPTLESTIANAAELRAQIEALRAELKTSVNALSEALTAISVSTNDIRKGVTLFAEQVAKRLQVKTIEAAKEAALVEKEAVQEVKSTAKGFTATYFPPNAPGA